MSFIFQHSFWWIPLILVVSFGIAFLFYFREKNYKELEKWKLYLLLTLRFFILFVVLLLIFDPLVRTDKEVIERPIIIFAQDNSRSVLLNSDSLYYKDQYITSVNDLITDLSVNYDVVQYNIGANVRRDSLITYTDDLSDLASVFPAITASYSGMNIGALVLASDGLFNTGNNPLFMQSGSYPIYTLALGDTNAQKDIYIHDIQHNKLAFYNNIFPVRAYIAADKCLNIPAKVEIENNGKIVYSGVVVPDKLEYFEQLDVELVADKVGIQQYEIRIEPLDGEISTQNNNYSFVVDVIDNRQKILFMGNAPHPDLGAMMSAIEKNPNFEVDLFYSYSDPQPVINDYDLVVLHQLPSVTNKATRLLSEIEQLKIPVLFVMGTQSSFDAFNQISTGLNVKYSGASFSDAGASFDNNFTAFTLDEGFIAQLSEYPPLQVLFAEFSFTLDATVMLNQVIGKIVTDKPLIGFVNKSEVKYGFVVGEGLWRWRIRDFQLNNSHEYFSNLVNRMLQYLITRRMKQKLLVETKRIVSDNESVIFNAELYNEAYEKYNDPDVNLLVTDEAEREYTFVMNKLGDSYRLNAGNLPPGAYSYAATTEFDGSTYEALGEFFVKDLNIELLRSRANHSLLYRLASNSGGEMFYPNQFDQLAQTLNNNDNIVTRIHIEQRLSNIISLIWIFFVLAVLAASEWFLRKFWGGY